VRLRGPPTNAVSAAPLVAGSLAVWGARGMPDDDVDWAIIY
jgi:hypothetical protein